MSINYDRLDMLDDYSCYLLGYFQADGWMQNYRGKYPRVGFESIDYQLIDDISKELGCKIYSRVRKFNTGLCEGRVGSEIYAISISSRFAKRLESYMDDYKDFSTLWSSFNREQKYAFIRGYFDGDGNIYNVKGSSRGQLTFYVADEFSDKVIKDFLEQEDLRYTIGYSKGATKPVKKYKVIRTLDIIKLRDGMYENSSVHLIRKKDKLDLISNENMRRIM